MATRFSLEPLQKSFGALVTDIRLPAIDEATFTELQAAWLDYALLIFPGQSLTVDEQVTFAGYARPEATVKALEVGNQTKQPQVVAFIQSH